MTQVEHPDQDGPGAGAMRTRGRVLERWSRLELAVLAIAVLPVLTAVARRSGNRWIPIGDNALIEQRARDVFSVRHFPLLGTWSSASVSAGKDLNHPGPLLFDLLAIPVKLFGGAMGVAIGVGFINAGAIIGTALVARRVRGRTGLLAGAAVAGLLAHSLGSSMLTDPWNPHVLVLPALLMLTCAWAVAAGDLAVLPLLFGVCSLCLQTHLGYAYLVPAVVVTALIGAGIVHVRRRRLDPDTRSADARAIRRSASWSVGTLAVLWTQPLIEQIAGAGQGNLARIATSTGGDEPTIGARFALRIVGGLIALPPWWNRGSIVEAVPLTSFDADGVTISPVGLPGLGPALGALVVFAVLLALGACWAWRRRDRPAMVVVCLAAVAVVVALASITIMPIGALGLSPHQMRWSWSIGAFTLLAFVVVVADVIGSTVGRVRVVDGGLAGVAVFAAVLNLPAYVQLAGPDTEQRAIPIARELSDEVRGFRTDDAVVLDESNLQFAEPYSAVVIAATQQADVDLRFAVDRTVRRRRRTAHHVPVDGARRDRRAGRE